MIVTPDFFRRTLAALSVKLLRRLVSGDQAASLLAELTDHCCPGNQAFQAFKDKGFFLLREHFYLPLPDYDDLGGAFFDSHSELVGLSLDADAMWKLAEKTLAPYNAEFREFPIHSPGPDYRGFYLINHGYMAVDGNLYYGLTRHLKPRRIVETGCGSSSLLCSAALERNAAEGSQTEYICIDPYPQPYLLDNPMLRVTRLVDRKIQAIDLELFTSLEAGDILFIDTSHCLRLGGDVQHIYNEILPRLRPGVHVHIHDISLPLPYPKVYLDCQYYWNEQYLLQAYLTHNNRVRSLWAGNWLRLADEARFGAVFPEFATMRQHFPSSEPSAFWFVTQ